MSQRSRRQDPYPWTREMPLAVILPVLVLTSFGVHLGRAVANVLAGCDWRFPSRVDLFSSLPDVLRGDAGAGLVDVQGPSASPSSLLVCWSDGADLAYHLCGLDQVGFGSLGAGTNEGRGELE